MKLEIHPANSLSPAEQSYIADWAYRIFAGQDQGLEWAEGDWRVLIWEGDQLASQVEIVERTARVGEQNVKLGGIGGVATCPAWRGHGLATLAMQQAMEFMCAELEVEFGLLVCGADTIPFYQRLGWQLVAEALVIEQSGEKVDFSTPVMVWSCWGTDWPAGKIDLCGLPW